MEEKSVTNVEENRIIASNLCYCYPEAQKNAVDDVSMRVKKGEFLAILGHNGSGKSTLAKLFNALYVPGSGTVWVCGMDTKDDDLVFDIRQHAGMVFQNPDNQIVATVVEEDVAFGLENNGVPPKEIRVRIDEALEAVCMTKYAKKAPHMLAGGQKQRVAIAGVLAMMRFSSTFVTDLSSIRVHSVLRLITPSVSFADSSLEEGAPFGA